MRFGARWIVLCDTNGGTLPNEIEAVVTALTAPRVPHPARGVRQTHRSGPGAWRASGLPR